MHHKFPSKHCFCCIPQILASCYFHFLRNIFIFLLRFLVWPVYYLEVCCLISVYFGGFLAVFCLLISSLMNYIVVWEQHCITSIILLLLRCVLLPEYVLFWSVLGENVCSAVSVHYVPLVDVAVDLSYVFTEFMPTGPFHFW